MSGYNAEQLDALTQIVRVLSKGIGDEKRYLLASAEEYLQFRNDVSRFLSLHFNSVCTDTCYQNKLSACCSREGIITFFADAVLNVLKSTDEELGRIRRALENPARPDKCVYLGPKGCLWRVKPIVCELFLCDRAIREVFGTRPDLAERWSDYEKQAKSYRWPDRPVLFDRLEAYFIERGCDSSLMYLHKSPGLLRIKRLSQDRQNR